jgi:eukaryotic-like serine/threonine-protein kinase
MEIERWKLVDDLLQSALELAPERREDFLQQVCAQDPALMDEIKSLLTSQRKVGDFLEQPAVEMAARALADESEPLLSTALVGQVISHYRLLKMIGRGGMGSVWLAERCDGRFERKVAIKFIHLAVLDQASAERFKREGAILGKLGHAQIAELIDAGLTSIGEPYLVLEYVEGQPIDEYCDQNKLGIEARIRLFQDVLSAVAHAHSNLIVHRDIKPSNVFVNHQGQVKLLDFGIAKVLADEANVGSASALTLEGGAMLTPRYAAPEQFSDAVITTATDIYSLGVLLYQLLTGLHPAGRGPCSAAQLIKAILDEEPQRASDAASATGAEAAADRATTTEKLRRLLLGDLDTIIAKAIRKNPADRYTSVSAFADDLQRFLEHKPVLARPDSLNYRATKFVRRNRAAAAVAVIAFIAVAAGVTGIVIQDRRARAERDFAIRQMVRIDQHDEFLGFLLSDAAPSGKPFTVNSLLDRAQHILERQKTSPSKLDLMEWIGVDYSAQDRHGQARPILEEAYKLSRQSTDPAVLASASCSLGVALSRDEDLVRADNLIAEGLRELPNDPQYDLTRITCLRQGSEVSRQKGEISEGVRRMELAQQLLLTSPFNSDEFQMGTSLDLAAMYSEAGRDNEALAAFERAAARMTSLGRDETETGVVLYNDWALELDQVGRPLEAEKIYRRVIDMSRDGETEEAVSPMILLNFARVQRELNHLPQAADYAERAYDKAIKVGDELVVNQSLLERTKLYTTQHNLPRAEEMLAEVEPRLRKILPPGHYAFAAITSDRALLAMENHDLPTALRLNEDAIDLIQAAIKARGEGAFNLPGLYIDRSAIDLASGQADQAAADAANALMALQPLNLPGVISSKLGRAYLAQARALSAQGKSAEARQAASHALQQLQGSVGADHPDTHAAQQLTD